LSRGGDVVVVSPGVVGVVVVGVVGVVVVGVVGVVDVVVVGVVGVVVRVVGTVVLVVVEVGRLRARTDSCDKRLLAAGVRATAVPTRSAMGAAAWCVVRAAALGSVGASFWCAKR
jgi:hypothetical protein